MQVVYQEKIFQLLQLMLYQYNARSNATHVPIENATIAPSRVTRQYLTANRSIVLLNESTNAVNNNGNNVLTQYPTIAARNNPSRIPTNILMDEWLLTMVLSTVREN